MTSADAARSRRWKVIAGLLAAGVAICVAVPVVVAVTGPVAGGWDETLGLIAGLLVASAGIAGSLILLGPVRR